MILKFETQVGEVKIGPRNFFRVRIFSGGFIMGLQRNLAIKCDKLSDDWNFVPTSLLALI
jgi:hypothetical protein